jgi:hypothetical protein
MVDLKLRSQTLDVDIDVTSDEVDAVAEVERLIPLLKEELQINIEWANPTESLPIPRAEALERSAFQRSYGQLHVYHFDYRSTVLAKVARSTERDIDDIDALVRSGRVAWPAVEELWSRVRLLPFGRYRYSPHSVDERMANARATLISRNLIHDANSSDAADNTSGLDASRGQPSA